MNNGQGADGGSQMQFQNGPLNEDPRRAKVVAPSNTTTTAFPYQNSAVNGFPFQQSNFALNSSHSANSLSSTNAMVFDQFPRAPAFNANSASSAFLNSADQSLRQPPMTGPHLQQQFNHFNSTSDVSRNSGMQQPGPGQFVPHQHFSAATVQASRPNSVVGNSNAQNVQPAPITGVLSSPSLQVASPFATGGSHPGSANPIGQPSRLPSLPPGLPNSAGGNYQFGSQPTFQPSRMMQPTSVHSNAQPFTPPGNVPNAIQQLPVGQQVSPRFPPSADNYTMPVPSTGMSVASPPSVPQLMPQAQSSSPQHQPYSGTGALNTSAIATTPKGIATTVGSQPFAPPGGFVPNGPMAGYPPIQRQPGPQSLAAKYPQYPTNQNQNTPPLRPPLPSVGGIRPPGLLSAQPQPIVQHAADDLSRLTLKQQQTQHLQQQYMDNSNIPSGNRVVNLLQQRTVLPPEGLEQPVVDLPTVVSGREVNTFPGVFRCTLNAVPQTNDLLKKSRLPLGLILHPFKDLKSLSVLQTVPIVRCRSCRAYINPFAQLLGSRRWRCNLCFRENDLPDEFHYDPRTKSYGEPDRRPEMRETTVEFVATSEYMLRQPQAAMYLYVLDVSSTAVQTGYLSIMCKKLIQHLDRLPGGEDRRIGFITFDASIHFYQFVEDLGHPRQMIVSDLEDVFIPSNNGFLVTVDEFREEIISFLMNLPKQFETSPETRSALGAAVKAAVELIEPFGGRVTVLQTVLPNVGPGALESREDPNLRASKDVKNLGPATDFYKQLSLACSGKQVGIDLFLLSTQYADLATLSEIAKFNGGCVHYYPHLHAERNPLEAVRFEQDLDRYLTRKIGFEAVLRIRCTRGLTLHTFHGNAFVRSTDLLALSNINPDAAFGVQMQYDDAIETNNVCFQAALLYTSSKGQRRIRVHTLCLPITNNLAEVHARADAEAIVCMLARLAVDRSIAGSLTDAREALVNSCVDALGSFGSTLTAGQRSGQILAPTALSLMPLFVLGLLKHPAFNFGTSIRLDSRIAAMSQFKTLPIFLSMLEIYPGFYPLHTISEEYPDPPLMQLSYEKVDRDGVYLLDTCSYLYVFVGQSISREVCEEVFGVSSYAQVEDDCLDLPELKTSRSELIRKFICELRNERPFSAQLRIIKEENVGRILFTQRMVDDRTESTFSYVEFLQFLQKEISPR